jgi:hypothetical protein
MIGSFKYGWFKVDSSTTPSFLYYTKYTYNYEILGGALNDNYGTTVAISTGGDIWCTGTPNFNSGSLTDAGIIEFYRNGTPFASIVGTGAGSNFGRTIAMNASGSRIVINRNTSARVYRHTGSSYAQLGNDIEFSSYYPSHYSMNGSGDIYAVGAVTAPTTVAYYGIVMVFELISNVWTQRGSSINGLSGSRLGACVLNKSGNILATGAPYSNNIPTLVGSVSTFEWNGSSWNIKGNPLFGLEKERFGFSVALNYEGTRLAVGVPGRTSTSGSSGQVLVYEWTGSDWSQLGSAIQAPLSGNGSFGHTISMNAAGDLLIVGAPTTNINGQNSVGSTHIFQWYQNNWINYVPTISSSAASDQLGTSVAMDGVGNHIVVGNPGYDTGGINQRGRALYYTLT